MSEQILIRTKDGNLKATLSGRHAAKVLTGIKGSWDSIKYVGASRRSCFIIEQGAVYTAINGSGTIEIMLDEGDVILPEGAGGS